MIDLIIIYNITKTREYYKYPSINIENKKLKYVVGLFSCTRNTIKKYSKWIDRRRSFLYYIKDGSSVEINYNATVSNKLINLLIKTTNKPDYIIETLSEINNSIYERGFHSYLTCKIKQLNNYGNFKTSKWEINTYKLLNYLISKYSFNIKNIMIEYNNKDSPGLLRLFRNYKKTGDIIKLTFPNLSVKNEIIIRIIYLDQVKTLPMSDFSEIIQRDIFIKLLNNSIEYYKINTTKLFKLN